MTSIFSAACCACLLCLSSVTAIWALNTVPGISAFPTLSSTPVVADGVTEYTITMTARDADGYNDINCIRLLFNYTESVGDHTGGRGYLAWGKSDTVIMRYGGSWSIQDASGGGRWGYNTSAWGGTSFITPLSCTTTVSGSPNGAEGTRTVTWTFRALPAWAWNPLTNDADAWAEDMAGAVSGWFDNPEDFEVVAEACVVYAYTPGPPVLSNPTAETIDVSINPADSNEDLFVIVADPSVQGRSYVQADGTLGASAQWRTKAQWGTTHVTGLESSTNYTFRAKAIPLGTGGCPSGFGPGAQMTTSTLVHAVDTSVSGAQMNRGVIGNATRLDAFPNKTLSWQKLWDVLYNTCARGVAGGLCADTYNWKDMSGQGVGHTGVPSAAVPTTLDWMRLARDHQSMPLLTANTRGIGPLASSGWCRFYYTDISLETVRALAADWVRYVNFILPNYREGDIPPPGDQAILDSINWYGRPKLLSPGEESTPRVTYWEIGNEPEVALPWCTDGAPKFPYSPEEYGIRYKQITQAMLAVDPTIKVGPCITTANNGNAYLDAVLSDPTNKVDFVAYHPYGPLYSYANTLGDTPETAEKALRYVKTQLHEYHDAIVSRIVANERDPSAIALMASEWNASNWLWECSPQIRRMSHAIGVAETLFTFTELGLLAANYWSHPAWCGDGTETPGYKVFEMAQATWGDKLVDSYSDGYNLRVYTMWNPQTYDLTVWALNLSDTRDKEIRLKLDHIGSCTTVTRHLLARLSGETSLFDTNEPPYTRPPYIDWITADVTDQITPWDFTINLPHATITVLEFRRAFSRLMPEGTPVNVSDWSVTAAYPSADYLYISPEDRSFGLRVAASFSGISVGDRVNVTGVLTTRKVGGNKPSERQISDAVVTKVSSGTPLKPLGITCRSVGGGAIGPVPGVQDGVGTNNVGSLVKIAGRVTDTRGYYFFVDDGSNVPNLYGSTTPAVGVMIWVPEVPAIQIGDIVSVTGVVEGSIPLPWNINRSFIRARTMDDIIVVN